MIEITIPFKTISVNHLYGLGRFGQKYLKPEAKKIREEIFEILKSVNINKTEQLKLLNTEIKLSVSVEIYEDWYTKKGLIKRKDVTNREKFLIDSVFEQLEIDDRRIFEYRTKKIQSEEEKAVIKIDFI